MQIFLRDVNGATTVQCVHTLGELRAVAASADRLKCGGVDLLGDDHSSLRELGVNENANVFVLARLLGGKKKRKKKKLHKGPPPKKSMRKQKKEKLTVLKYYKFDENGKVIRLKRACGGVLCGPGTYMADHHDRFTCGKCHTMIPK